MGSVKIRSLKCFFDKINIKTRIWCLNIGALVVIFVTLGIALGDMRDDLEKMKITEIRHLIESAHSQIRGYHEKHLNGLISEKEAKTLAKEAIGNIRYDRDNYVWINDAQGLFVTHPHIEGKEGIDIEDVKGNSFVKSFIDETVSEGKAITRYWWKRSEDGPQLRKLAYTGYFEPWEWVVGSGIYVDKDLDEIVIDSFIEVGSYGAGMIVVLSIVTILIGRSITIPLKNAVTAMREIGSGDGNLTLRLPENGNNEISELGRNFNYFVGKIQWIVKEVRDSTSSVSLAAENLAIATDKNNISIDKQCHETDQIASAINEMSSSVQEVASNSNRVSLSTKETFRSTELGKESALNTGSAVESLYDNINRSSKVISELDKDCNDISTVLDVIHSIAEQTNLLALNAAIEAARAGETGRGFAVVADEVRALANRTEESTNEISRMIASLQKGAKAAVDSMNENLEHIEITKGAVSDVVESLSDIVVEVKKVDDMMVQIATATEEQSSVSEEISMNITNIVHLSQETSGSSQRTSSSSKELTKLSENLSSVVSQFKV
ncbi:hypothetical protein BGL48_03780 [Salinivibrio sp. SS3]|uniref:methyl-accepting chemotaxis protein n=1 Tax=Salinivibrio TaxID=51366 RepID=UPI0008482A6B|nr:MULTISPECIES: methyl-accepting chemotaxis protein [Salinivibrio]ODP96208.1 hypothetical protein BGL48_03780 [Salinivibrio sp. BNH]WBA13290.1 methyl-accepting chemotaxis protein [Salinivibrio kushneri]